MKFRSFYLSAVFIGLAGVVSIPAIFKCTEHFNILTVRADDGVVDNNIYLTTVQTRALFGDDIAADYYDSSGTFHHEFFRFYSTAVNINGLDYLIYQGDFSSSPSGSNDNKDWIIHLEPSVALSHLYTFDMDIGFRVTGSWSLPYSRVQKNKVVVSANTDNFNIMSPYSFEMSASNQGGGYYSASIIDLTESQSHDTWKMSYIRTYLYSNHSFSVSFYDSDYPAEYGVFQNGMYDSFDGKCYMIIQCPFLSDTYNIDSSNGSSSSVPDSSSSVPDSPDYSGSLQDILDKLDEIAEKQGLYGQVTNEQLNDIFIENQRQNSKLDSANDKLNQANSRLDGVNSRLDNISGELHDLNSAPTGTLPRTGAENSEFDRQAEMYLSDFQNEYSDPENQPFEVAEGSSGFLSFVREFLLRSHLAGVLPVLALLFILHYTIFDRRG